jgi:hypothetical protein
LLLANSVSAECLTPVQERQVIVAQRTGGQIGVVEGAGWVLTLVFDMLYVEAQTLLVSP